MNNRREDQRRQDDQALAARVEDLQGEVEQLEGQLGAANETVAELQAQLASAPDVAPAGDDALRGLASTYRAALRNGHPDAAKHLESLLSALGA